MNQKGIVYQKDLGKKTEALGKTMQEYNPDSGGARRRSSRHKPLVGRKPSNFR